MLRLEITSDGVVSIGVCTADTALAERLCRGMERWACGECVRLVPEVLDRLPGRDERVDILLLDLDSMDVKDSALQNAGYGGLIIVSGNGEAAIRAFRWHPYALLKPDFAAPQLKEAMSTCLQLWQKGLLFLELPEKRKRSRLPLGRVRYIEAKYHYCIFYQQTMPVRSRFAVGELETLLPNPPFLRCHRSYLVRVDEVEKLTYSALRLKGDDVSLPVGRRYHEALVRAFEAWQGRGQ